MTKAKKPVSLLDILRRWVRKELPQFHIYEVTWPSAWQGFIRCRCCEKTPRAFARIEADNVWLFYPLVYKKPSHYEQCDPCHCNERSVSIYDNKEFAKLKKLLVAHHKKICEGQEK